MKIIFYYVISLTEYPNIVAKSLKILLQLSTSYLCKSGFSALVNIKTKKEIKRKSVENKLTVYLSNTRPNIKEICKKHQAQ